LRVTKKGFCRRQRRLTLDIGECVKENHDEWHDDESNQEDNIRERQILPLEVKFHSRKYLHEVLI
jgi:hypothetical protein